MKPVGFAPDDVGTYRTLDLKTQVQAIVNRAGWEPGLAPREREQRSLCERGDEGGLGQGQIDAPVPPEVASMLSRVFF